MTKVEDTQMLMSDVLPKECVRFEQRVESFDPDNNQVTLSNGQVVNLLQISI